MWIAPRAGSSRRICCEYPTRCSPSVSIPEPPVRVLLAATGAVRSCVRNVALATNRSTAQRGQAAARAMTTTGAAVVSQQHLTHAESGEQPDHGNVLLQHVRTFEIERNRQLARAVGRRNAENVQPSQGRNSTNAERWLR